MSELPATKALLVGLLEIGSQPNIDILFDLIVREAPQLVGAEECSIFWKDDLWREHYRDEEKEEEHSDAFYRRATYAAKKDLIGRNNYKPGEGLTGYVIKYGKSLRINDITDKDELSKIDPRLVWKDKEKGYNNSQEKEKQRAFLAVPVKTENEVVGVIRIAKTKEPLGKFSEESQILLEAFADKVAAIINRAEELDLKQLWENLYLSGISLKRDKFVNYLQQVADEIPKYLDAKACSIFLVEMAGIRQILKLRTTTTNGPLSAKVGKAIYEKGEGLTLVGFGRTINLYGLKMLMIRLKSNKAGKI